MTRCRPHLWVGSIVVTALMVGIPARASTLWREGDSGDVDPELGRLSRAIARLAEKVRPAVIQIRASQKAPAEGNGESQPRRSRGSGFIINPEGYILTAHHVIDRADEIEVQLADRRRLRAELVAAEPHVDVALLKVEGRNFPTLALGDSDKVEVGELVGSVSYPFGRESALSLGVISRKGGRHALLGAFDFIQTDAVSNAGTSGGPLVDTRGHVIGMITMASQNGNTGFAVPINAIKSIVPRLLKGEKIVWGWLGVKVSELTLELAERLGLWPARGVLVSSVVSGQPAEKSKLLAQDVILAIEGIEVNSPRELVRIVSGAEAGKQVALTIFRQGQILDITVTLGAKPATAQGREG